MNFNTFSILVSFNFSGIFISILIISNRNGGNYYIVPYKEMNLNTVVETTEINVSKMVLALDAPLFKIKHVHTIRIFP